MSVPDGSPHEVLRRRRPVMERLRFPGKPLGMFSIGIGALVVTALSVAFYVLRETDAGAAQTQVFDDFDAARMNSG